MSPPEQWRFQWPDGTWIRWNPDTEAWEKEISDATGAEPRAEPLDIAPEERWLLDSLEPPADARVEESEDRAGATEITVGPEVALSSAPGGVGDDDGDDDRWDDNEDDDGDEVALGPRSSAAHVISEEEPKGSLRPTILAGAGVGLAVGIVVSVFLR